MVKRDLGLYIHIPFCAHKCDYCDFLSAVGSPDEQSYYFRVLKKEIRGYEALENLYLVRTIFFGGGTPSIVNPTLLAGVMEQLRDQYEIAEDAEITIECNPGTLDREKLLAYRGMGINRLSLGLQSADNSELKTLGRIHTWETFEDSFRKARMNGFDNIKVDLMSGLPGQTMDTWKKTLEAVVRLKPEHISAYGLIVEENTPFYERYGGDKGRVLLPREKVEREMYHFTRYFLDDYGYHRYEISNYALEGRECRHNLTYWTGGDYVGFGLGASSYLGGCRFSNPKDKNEYWQSARGAYQHYRTLSPQSDREKMEEFMFLGLRLMKGISRKAFEEQFHIPFEQVYEKPVRRMLSQGFLQEQDGWLSFTEKGIDVSNTLLAEFLL